MKLSLESPIMNFTDKIAEVLIAGFLWLLCSVPVITIGPATAALYYVVVKVVRRNRGTVVSSFFHSLKDNLKQGIVITVIYLLYIVILAAYISIIKLSSSFAQYPYIFIVGGMILAAPLIFTLPYIFPVISRFRAGIGKQFEYALHMSVRFFPITIVLDMMLIVLAFFIYLFPFFLLIIPGFYIFISSLFIEKILKKYMKSEREKYKNQEELPWYLEE